MHASAPVPTSPLYLHTQGMSGMLIKQQPLHLPCFSFHELDPPQLTQPYQASHFEHQYYSPRLQSAQGV